MYEKDNGCVSRCSTIIGGVGLNIACLMITYEPDIQHLKIVLSSICHQVYQVIIIDNGSRNQKELLELTRDDIIIIPLADNFGIARATNIGIMQLANKKADFILLSDQDTVYTSDYIATFEKLYMLQPSDSSIIAYAPKIFDKVSNVEKHTYVLKHKKSINKHIQCNSIIFQTIASGLLINYSKLLDVGGMNENLFIDMVDFEWCWKVFFTGYKIMYLPSLCITHSLGDATCNFLGKNIAIRNVIRYYYIIRNTIYLSFYTRYLNPITKFFLFMDAIKYFIGYNILTHGKYCRLLCLAVFHGINKKLGRFDNCK